uniref:Uncharacterized protein n=1 Tax=Daphnia galeata TaxID=27404 RepID=A0A8J2RWT3_9CRUS|nr:unnamed protein product [Daphnia galeata]
MKFYKTNDDSCQNNSKINCGRTTSTRKTTTPSSKMTTKSTTKPPVTTTVKAKSSLKPTLTTSSLKTTYKSTSRIPLTSTTNKKMTSLSKTSTMDPNIHYFYSSRNFDFIAKTRRPKAEMVRWIDPVLSRIAPIESTNLHLVAITASGCTLAH